MRFFSQSKFVDQFNNDCPPKYSCYHCRKQVVLQKNYVEWCNMTWVMHFKLDSTLIYHISLIGNISNAQLYRNSRHWYCNFPIVKQQIETKFLKLYFRQLIFSWHWVLISALLWALGFCKHFRFIFSLVLHLQLA